YLELIGKQAIAEISPVDRMRAEPAFAHVTQARGNRRLWILGVLCNFRQGSPLAVAHQLERAPVLCVEAFAVSFVLVGGAAEIMKDVELLCHCHVSSRLQSWKTSSASSGSGSSNGASPACTRIATLP